MVKVQINIQVLGVWLGLGLCLHLGFRIIIKVGIKFIWFMLYD
jgi:hypothetical protein